MSLRRYTAALLLGLLLGATTPAWADDRPAALEQEKRWFAGFAGATSQARFSVDDGAGDSTTSLDDGLLLRAGRYGRPARYGIDLLRVRYDEAETWTVTAHLDYVISGGGIFSGYLG